MLAATLTDFGLATSGLPPATREIPLGAFFASPLGLRLAFDLFIFSAAAGLFVVPIFAAIQAWAGEERRARVVGAVNALNYLMMVAGSIVAMLLLQVVGMSEPTALVLLGLANVAAAVWVFRNLPANTLAFVARIALKSVYRLEVVGAQNLPRPGECAAVAVSHVSFLDAAVLTAIMEEPPILAVDRVAARRRLVASLIRFIGVSPLNPSRPLTARALVAAARAGRALALFPEGRTALTPVLMRDYEALSLMIEKTGAPVTPVRIEGAEQTLFSRLDPTQSGRRLLPRIKVTVLPPRRLAVPYARDGRTRRRAAGVALVDLMSDFVFETTDIRRTLHAAFEGQARKHGLRRIVVEDPLAGPLTMRMFRIGVGVLARKLIAISAAGETVGLMLPNANGATVTFMALQATGRVVAMLNFTAGPLNLVGACQAAQIRLVLTSRVFVEKADLAAVVEAIGRVAQIVWLEDVRASATTQDKLIAALTAGRAFAHRGPDDPAAVLFTSGTEGAPKGVVLSHANILANCAQVEARYDLRVSDICFNPLPMFHAFGLTGGTLLGLMTSMRVYLYPTPLHYRQIPELIDRVGATVLFGTDTFLAAYARNADPEGFRSLRYVIAGGEALKAETRRDLPGEIRPRPVRGLRRDRGLAGAGGQRADVQPPWHGRQAPAARRGAAGAGPRHRRRRAVLCEGAERDDRLLPRRQPRRNRAASGRLARHRRHRGDRRRRLRRDQGPGQAVRQARRRVHLARRDRRPPVGPVARRGGLRRCARPKARRAGDSRERPRRGDQGRGRDLDEDQGRLRHHGPLFGRRAGRDPAARLRQDRLRRARQAAAGKASVRRRFSAVYRPGVRISESWRAAWRRLNASAENATRIWDVSAIPAGHILQVACANLRMHEDPVSLEGVTEYPLTFDRPISVTDRRTNRARRGRPYPDRAGSVTGLGALCRAGSVTRPRRAPHTLPLGQREIGLRERAERRIGNRAGE